MGQKVNPISYRLSAGYRDYNLSSWFAVNKNLYANFVSEDNLIRQEIMNHVPNANISRILITRGVKNITVTICSSRIGALIGKKGIEIDKINSKLSKLLKVTVLITLSEVKKPVLCANLVAQNVGNQLLNRISHRRAMKKAMSEASRMADCKGFKISCAGRLGGAEIARTEHVNYGSVPLHNLRAVIDYASHQVKTTCGIIGIKVWVHTGSYKKLDTNKPSRPSSRPSNRYRNSFAEKSAKNKKKKFDV